MTLEQWADLSQVIAAAAVFGSLIFIGVQLRQNTRAIMAQTSQAHASGYQQIITSISDNGEFARIWRVGLADYQSLDADERARFLAFASMLFRFYESSHVQMQGRMLGAEHWHTIAQQVADLVTQPGIQAWWVLRRHWHSATFRDWIEALPKHTPAVIYDAAAPGDNATDASQSGSS